MRKTRKLNNALDECLERLLLKGETVEQCLQSFPEYADELKPLLETALSVKQASAIQPRPELRDRARYQLYSVLQNTAPKKSHSFFNWQPQWAVVLTAVLVFLLAGSGTVAAASSSMPDQVLYPVKLATEKVRLALTPSSIGKAELYARLADKRVEEIARMADESKAEQIERVTQGLNTYLTRIIDLSSVKKIKDGAVPVAPAAAEAPELKRALEPEKAPAPSVATGLAERGKEKGGKDGRREKLRETVAHYASSHPERLRALLDKVPPEDRPALLRAIAVSEDGYKKALESLDEDGD
ncbi:MAG: hypothetical protein HY529_01485 [Chloroflexi bacterium]|nr:hypothetical protein [Chloroflexota bacterium]